MNDMTIRIGQPLSALPELRGVRPSVEVPSFKDTLSRMMSDVNRLQFEAGDAIEEMVTGQVADLHQVMLAVEKASTSLSLLIEIRNRVIESYTEIMRMPV